jgi:hypothetical protein
MFFLVQLVAANRKLRHEATELHRKLEAEKATIPPFAVSIF